MAAAVNQLRLVPYAEQRPVVARPEPAPRRRTRHARIAPVAAAFAEPASPRSAIAAPDVPGRRYLGADSVPAAEPERSHGALAGPGAGIVRATLAGPSASAPASPAVAGSVDLPPEAYRGPSGTQAR